MFKLRSYQSTGISQIRNSFANKNKRVLCALGTGGGKSVMIRSIFEMALTKNPNGRFLYIVHRSILISQMKQTLKGLDIDIMTLQKAGRDKLGKYNLIVSDETHFGHGSKLFNNLEYDFFLGLSASPITIDGFALDGYDDLIDIAQLKDLIDLGFMPPLKVMSIANIETNKLKTQNGDFSIKESFDLMSKSSVMKNIVDGYEKHAKGLKTIVYCVNIQHSEQVAQEFRNKGYKCEAIHSKSNDKTTLERFKNNELDIVTNCDVLTTGLDLPDVYCLILASPTKSYIKAIQIYGRIRLNPKDKNKVGLILDMARVVENTLHPYQKIDLLKQKQVKGTKCKCTKIMKLTNRFTEVINDYEYKVVSCYSCTCGESLTVENIKLINMSLCDSCGQIFEPVGGLQMTTSEKNLKFELECKCCGAKRNFRTLLYTDDELKEVSLHQAMQSGATWEDVAVILKKECKDAGYKWQYATRLIDRCKNVKYEPKQVIEFIKTIKRQGKRISQLMYI